MKHKLRSPHVYIPNRSNHDFTKARDFGELCFITEGSVNRFSVNDIARQVREAMSDATASDYLIISSLPVLNAIAAAIFAHRFGRLNLLLHDAKTGGYLSRSIVMREMEDMDDISDNAA